MRPGETAWRKLVAELIQREGNNNHAASGWRITRSVTHPIQGVIRVAESIAAMQDRLRTLVAQVVSTMDDISASSGERCVQPEAGQAV